MKKIKNLILKSMVIVPTTIAPLISLTSCTNEDIEIQYTNLKDAYQLGDEINVIGTIVSGNSITNVTLNNELSNNTWINVQYISSQTFKIEGQIPVNSYYGDHVINLVLTQNNTNYYESIHFNVSFNKTKYEQNDLIVLQQSNNKHPLNIVLSGLGFIDNEMYVNSSNESQIYWKTTYELVLNKFNDFNIFQYLKENFNIILYTNINDHVFNEPTEVDFYNVRKNILTNWQDKVPGLRNGWYDIEEGAMPLCLIPAHISWGGSYGWLGAYCGTEEIYEGIKDYYLLGHEYLGHSCAQLGDEYVYYPDDDVDTDVELQEFYDNLHRKNELLNVDYKTITPSQWHPVPKTEVLWQEFVGKPGYHEGVYEGASYTGHNSFRPYERSFMRGPKSDDQTNEYYTKWEGLFRFAFYRKIEFLKTHESLDKSLESFWEWDKPHLDI